MNYIFKFELKATIPFERMFTNSVKIAGEKVESVKKQKHEITNV